MVVSRLHPDIIYNESTRVIPTDRGRESVIYTVFPKQQANDLPDDLPMAEWSFAMGAPQYQYATLYNIVYLPIYLVTSKKGQNDDDLHASDCVGVVECKASEIVDLLDEDEDVDTLPFPLLFSFVDSQYLEKKGWVPPPESAQTVPSQTSQTLPPAPQVGDESVDDVSIGDSVDLDGVVEYYQSVPHFQTLAPLDEETAEEAKQTRAKFKSGHHWIETFFKSNHYDVPSGQSIWDSLVQALFFIGKVTNTHKLRLLLSETVTETDYQEQKDLYRVLAGEKTTLTETKKQHDATLKILKKRMQNISLSKTNIEDLVKQVGKEEIKLATTMMQYKEVDKQLKQGPGYIHKIPDFKSFREHLASESCILEPWMLPILEEALQIKFIVFNEDAYMDKALHQVMNCAPAAAASTSNRKGEKGGGSASPAIITSPEYYMLIISSQRKPIQPVIYKKRPLLRFVELPYDIKVLITNKCMEHAGADYTTITDFIEFRRNLGVTDDVTMEVQTQIEEEYAMAKLEGYDADVVFVFHETAADAAPGKGTGERIPTDRILEFLELGKVKHWRRMLDDKHTDAPFTCRGKTWKSVFHFLVACKFKTHPEFASHFAATGQWGQDVKLAAQASDPKDKKLRPSNVTMDIDFMLTEEEDRQEALSAKFQQNKMPQLVLLASRKTLLKRARHGKPALKDVLLMNLRNHMVPTTTTTTATTTRI